MDTLTHRFVWRPRPPFVQPLFSLRGPEPLVRAGGPAAFRRACARCRPQKGSRQNDTFFFVGARAGLKSTATSVAVFFSSARTPAKKKVSF